MTEQNTSQSSVDDALLAASNAPEPQLTSAPVVESGGVAGEAERVAEAQVDLNTASAQDLRTLPGIGPMLAARIIEHREREGPFATVEDLRRVAGIGESNYQKIASRITVLTSPTNDQVAEPLPTPNTEPPLVEAFPLPPLEAPPSPIIETPLPAPSVMTPEPEPPKQPPLPSPPPKPSVGLKPKRDWVGLMWMSTVSAILGAVLALVALAGLNQGTLLLNQQPDVLALTSRAEELAQQTDALKTEAAALRARLDGLDGLSARMGQVEAAVNDMATRQATMDTDLLTLTKRADALAADIEAFRATAGRFDAFLNGLQALLAEVQGTPTPTLSPTPTPVK